MIAGVDCSAVVLSMLFENWFFWCGLRCSEFASETVKGIALLDAIPLSVNGCGRGSQCRQNAGT